MSHYPTDNSNSANADAGDDTGIQYRKPLGRYLVEAGLLSQSQLDIALRDQEYSGYHLGEILVLRGWVQQSVIDLVVKRLQPVSNGSHSELQVVIEQGQTLTRGIVEREGLTTILAEDDTQLETWDQETTAIHRIGEPESYGEADQA